MCIEFQTSSLITSHFSPVQELISNLPGAGPGFKSRAGLKACLLASSRWELTLLGRPPPSEARLGCKLHSFCWSCCTALLPVLAYLFPASSIVFITVEAHLHLVEQVANRRKSSLLIWHLTLPPNLSGCLCCHAVTVTVCSDVICSEQA